MTDVKAESKFLSFIVLKHQSINIFMINHDCIDWWVSSEMFDTIHFKFTNKFTRHKLISRIQTCA